MPAFQLVGLPHDAFEPLFSLTDRQLAGIGARRVTATEQPGYPCRVSLADAAPGEELLLLPYGHQPANSPYRASGPIYVRRGARQQTLAPGEVTSYVATRLMSLRAYDAAHMIVAAQVCEGAVVAEAIEQQMASADVAYLHLHYARRGCFSCLVKRV